LVGDDTVDGHKGKRVRVKARHPDAQPMFLWPETSDGRTVPVQFVINRRYMRLRKLGKIEHY
jgi:hypothetical protein